MKMSSSSLGKKPKGVVGTGSQTTCRCVLRSKNLHSLGKHENSMKLSRLKASSYGRMAMSWVVTCQLPLAKAANRKRHCKALPWAWQMFKFLLPFKRAVNRFLHRKLVHTMIQLPFRESILSIVTQIAEFLGTILTLTWTVWSHKTPAKHPQPSAIAR